MNWLTTALLAATTCLPPSDLGSAVARGDLDSIERELRMRRYLIDRPMGRGRFALLPISQAVVSDQLASLEKLVELGADLDGTDVLGRSVLHHAVTLDRREIVEYLDPGHADIVRPDEIGRTPLHLAALGGRVELLERLLPHAAQGVVFELADQHGWTPLHFAASGGHVGVLRAMGSPPASSLAAATLSGKTPLHVAAERGRLGFVEALLAAGASPGARDDLGRTPADLAGDAAVAAFLRGLEDETAPPLHEVERPPTPEGVPERAPIIDMRYVAPLGPPGGIKSGPLFRIWDDGTVVFAPILDVPGEDLMVGRIDAATLEVLLDEVRETGLDRTPMFHCGPGGHSTGAQIHLDDKSSYHCVWGLPEEWEPDSRYSGELEPEVQFAWNRFLMIVERTRPVLVAPFDSK